MYIILIIYSFYKSPSPKNEGDSFELLKTSITVKHDANILFYTIFHNPH